MITLLKIMILIISEIECPARCSTCRGANQGNSWDGGLRLNSDNVCEHFCSRWGYCGDGPEFSVGTDCTGCVQGDFSLSIYKKSSIMIGCLNENVMFSANRYDVLGKRPKRVFIGRYKCDDYHWRGYQSSVSACQARCKGYSYMVYVKRGDRNCACQNSCKSKDSCGSPSNCDTYRLNK